MSESILISMLLDEYESLLKNEPDWPPALVEETGYRIWAVHEMLDIVTGNPFKDCEWLIEDFLFEMQCFAKAPSLKDSDPNIFEVAANEAETILALLTYPAEE